jgi:hypothetical protein
MKGRLDEDVRTAVCFGFVIRASLLFAHNKMLH